MLDELNGVVITVEDNVLHGGFGEAVKNYLYGKNKVINFGHKDEFCDIRDIKKTFVNSGLTTENIQKTIDAELFSLEKSRKV